VDYSDQTTNPKKFQQTRTRRSGTNAVSFCFVWNTKALNLGWLLNLREQGKPQNKRSKKGAEKELENANLKNTRIRRQVRPLTKEIH
jgi:hypothetical protein